MVGDLIHAPRKSVSGGSGPWFGPPVRWRRALGITNIDPIPHGLLSNGSRIPNASMPDIDIDFDDRRRGEMVRYATDRWGSTKSSAHHLRHDQNQSGY